MRDLDYYRNLQRPAANVKPGDEVIIASTYRRTDFEEHGIVMAVARVWVTVRSENLRDYRFRLDGDQAEDRDGNGKRFATPAQHEFDQQMKQAGKVLRDHRVEVLSRAIVPDGHLIAMADLLAALDQPASGDESKEA